ncbi:MAG: hypothetical protein FWE85_00860 [Clostridiales bacterium]|nr:hypothetical protein [Clostridiales bacterium]
MGFSLKDLKASRAMDKMFKELDKRQKKYFALIEADKIHEVLDEDRYIYFVNWFFENKASGFEDILKKPLPIQYVLSMQMVLDRIYMEDFEQVYTDADLKRLAYIAAEGLDELGLIAISKVLKEANKIYETNKAYIDSLDTGTDDWGDLLDKELWKGLEGEFSEVYPLKDHEFGKIMGRYILENQQYFKGDYL